VSNSRPCGCDRIRQNLYDGKHDRVSKPPRARAHPNKTLAAQLYPEFSDFFPKNRVEYFASYVRLDEGLLNIPLSLFFKLKRYLAKAI
jgi:hypothetical protein